MYGSAVDDDSPKVYLNRAIDILQQHSIKRETIDWDVLRSQALALAKEAQTPQETYPAIKFAIKQLGDNHSFLKEADKAKASQIARRQGLGFRSIDGVIVQVHPSSPAQKAGIQVRDKLETVEGVPYAHWKAQNSSRIDFFQGEHIHLTLYRAGHPSFNIELRKAEFEANLAPQSKLLAEGIGYIELPGTEGKGLLADGRRYCSVVQQHIRSLEQEHSVSRWIVDLRLNGGGNVWPMLAGIGPLLGEDAGGSAIGAKGQILHKWRYIQGEAWLDDELVETVRPDYRLQTPQPKVAVVTSHLTASSGEGVVIAFRGCPNSRIIGQSTRGLTLGNLGFRLDDGAVLVLATAYGTDRTGKIYQGAISPDTDIKPDWSQLGTNNDPVLNAAINWLTQV